MILPASLPWLLASLRTSLGLSLSGAIVGEYLGASRGMGWVIADAGERYDMERVLCCVAVIVVTTIYSGVEYFMKNADILAEAK